MTACARSSLFAFLVWVATALAAATAGAAGTEALIETTLSGR